MSLSDLCESQIEGVKLGLKNTIPEEVLRNIRKVIVTGCGDSYFASLACIPAFKKYAGEFGSNFSALRAIDVARHADLKKDADSTLVIAVSASGSAVRLQELLRRANTSGCHTLAVTNKSGSIVGRESKYCLNVNTPAFETPNPGLRNYYASYMGLFAIAVKLGEAKGIAGADELEMLFDQIRVYTADVSKVLEKIDDEMFELALSWKGFKAFETVGDGSDYSTAQFIAAKFVEVAGVMASAVNSEDWCHVEFFARNVEKVGTIIVGDVEANNKSRVAETVHQATTVGRPVLFVANGTVQEFGIDEQITVCSLPKTPKGFEFISPMLMHVPGSILASYTSALLDEPYFRDFAYKDAMTLTTSKVVVLTD